MFGTNMGLLQDFHTSVVSQTAPENSLIFKVTEGMLGISTFGFTTLNKNKNDKNASISDPFLLTAPNNQDEDSTVDNSLNDAVNNCSDLTHNCDADMREGGNGEEVLHYEDLNQDVGTAVLAGNDTFLTENITEDRKRFITQSKHMIF